MSSDLEFHSTDSSGKTRVHETFADACLFATVHACSRGQPVTIDVVAWSEEGARAWGGDAAVESYREDPEASVFERIVVRAESQGRIA